MIQNADELRICQRRLFELQTRAEQIVTHPQKSRRVKEMELAGVRGMVEQLQGEGESEDLCARELQRMPPYRHSTPVERSVGSRRIYDHSRAFPDDG